MSDRAAAHTQGIGIVVWWRLSQKVCLTARANASSLDISEDLLPTEISECRELTSQCSSVPAEELPPILLSLSSCVLAFSLIYATEGAVCNRLAKQWRPLAEGGGGKSG